MSGRQHRMGNPSQTSNSPLLPRPNVEEDGWGWLGELVNSITWMWYTSAMSAGGVALILQSLPFGPHWLWILGEITFIASLLCFLWLPADSFARFIKNPCLAPRCIVRPFEGIFVATFAGALGILIINGATYAEKMHIAHGEMLRAAFWVFLVVALVFGVGAPLVRLPQVEQEVRESTQMAMQMVLPLTLVGYAAAAVVTHISPSDAHLAAPIILVGIAVECMGILTSLLYLPPFLDRLQTALPPALKRPSLFIAAGPPAFTSLSFALLAEQSLRLFPSTSVLPAGNLITGEALYPVLLFAALSSWGLSAWLFMIALAANLSWLPGAVMHPQLFVLVFFLAFPGAVSDLVFPSAGFALASLQMSKIMGSPKVLEVAAEMLGVVVILVWVGVVVSFGFSQCCPRGGGERAGSQRIRW